MYWTEKVNMRWVITSMKSTKEIFIINYDVPHGFFAMDDKSDIQWCTTAFYAGVLDNCYSEV